MGKHADKLGSFESFRAPWETEAGKDAEIDKPTLKRLIFNLKAGEAEALDAKAEVKEALEKAQADLEQAKEEAASANGEEAQKKIDRLEAKVADLTRERDGLVAAKELADLRAEVLGDFATQNPKAAKYVKGETREELEKSLEEVKADFGIADESGDEDDGDDEEKIRTRPRTTLRNPADRKSGEPGEQEIDFDKVADDIVGASVFR